MSATHDFTHVCEVCGTVGYDPICDRCYDMSIYKPAPGHNPLRAPAMCMCVACCRIIAGLRCPAIDPETGAQCGDYRHRGKTHTLLPCTVFLIAAERIAADGLDPT